MAPNGHKFCSSFFLARVFHTGLRNLYKLQLCTKSDYITVIYVAASFWCTFFYHFFNDTHRYSKNIDWQGTVVRVQIVHRIRIFTSCNLSSEVRRNGVRWIEMEDASSRTHDTRDSLPSWRLAELLIESPLGSTIEEWMFYFGKTQHLFCFILCFSKHHTASRTKSHLHLHKKWTHVGCLAPIVPQDASSEEVLQCICSQLSAGPAILAIVVAPTQL